MFVKEVCKETMSYQSKKAKEVLAPYKEQVELLIKRRLEIFGQTKTLNEAGKYVLMDGGKRLRPALVLMIAKALGLGADVTEVALAVELFHTASLVADDLPLMDDEVERRKKLPVHKVFGETVALLLTYGLIAAGYECIARNGEMIKHSSLPFASRAGDICLLALKSAAENSGFSGATEGQYLDLFSTNSSFSSVKEIVQRKTISLFEVSFILGWLFGGGPEEKLKEVKKAASHFGMAFQLKDDLIDSEQDRSGNSKANFVNIFGKEETLKVIAKEEKKYLEVVEKLEIDVSELKEIIN